MSFEHVIQSLRRNPGPLLNPVHPLSLLDFVAGYKAADMAPTEMLRAVTTEIEGPSEADLGTRALLRFRDPHAALDKALTLIAAKLATHGQLVPVPGPRSQCRVIDGVRGPIEQGRTGVLLAEPTVQALANHVEGFLTGLMFVNPALASSERAAFGRFEATLRERFACPHACWSDLVRVFRGPCESGVRSFVVLWDESLLTAEE